MRTASTSPLISFSLFRFENRFVVSISGAIVLLFICNVGHGTVRVEAYRGEPFGIGRVTIDLGAGDSSSPASDDRVALRESNDRVLYPVVEDKSARPARRLLQGFLGIQTPKSATIYFMFRGDDPLQLTAYSPSPHQLTIEPEDDAEEFNELLDDWWNATSARYQQVFRAAEYPVVVENFVTATWARRLDRQMPQPKRYLVDRFKLGEPWISRLMGNEAYQTEVERDLLLGGPDVSEQASIPIASVSKTQSNPIEANSQGASTDNAQSANGEALPQPKNALLDTIESIAAHVPQECFYLRFGNFTNYLWFRDFMRHWQGDLGNMMILQSVDHNNSDRFQQQIAVGESKLARVMGSTVIRDVAIIGLDPYMRDGAAMGILFQANNSFLLKNNLSGQREEAKKRYKDAAEETFNIAGQEVSFFHSPDGRLRSFYAVDGDYHLVCNSRKLVERFLESGAGKNSLAKTPDFAAVRQAMPLTREDTIFLFAPRQFFQNLAGPQYRVELDRRLRSIGEMRALKLASLSAAAEGVSVQSVDDLITADLLPAGFGKRADGSKLIAVPSPDGNEANGTFRDSLRGDVGSMTPIPDMQLSSVTPSEAESYKQFEADMQQTVGTFAPVAVGIKREVSPKGDKWDRITADVRVAPYSQMPLARWPNMLGPAMTSRVAPIAGDVASLDVVIGALGDPIHVFGGLRDFNTPLIVRQGEVKPDAPTSEYMRAYVGAWPRPHLLDRFLGRSDGPVDADGIARTNGLFQLWFRRADDFFLFSFKRDVLLEVGQQLGMVEAERPAQIRFRIEDLSDKKLATAVNGFGYMRARDASASGSRFMNSMTTLLHVPPVEARPIAEDLVGGKFDCPLGGEYVLLDTATGEPLNKDAADGDDAEALPPQNATAIESQASDSDLVLWTSTAPAPQNRFSLTEIPTDYQMPLLEWFRGLSTDVARVDDELILHAELDMNHIEIGPAEEPTEQGGGGGLKLPSLGDLFGGLGKKDDDVKPAAATDAQPSDKK